MKRLTNKILLLISIVILIAAVSSLVYFKSFAELTPSPVSVTKLTQELKLEGFNSVTNGRGFWRINIEQADTQNVAVYCGDNLFENYLDISVTDGELFLNIDDEFKYEKMALMDVYIKSPDIERISPQNTSVYWLKSIQYDSLQINATGISLAVLDTSSINKLEITALGNTSVKAISCNIEELKYSLEGNSIAEFSEAPKMYDGNISVNAFLKTKEQCIVATEKEFYYKDMKIDLFPGLPVIENLNELSDYMQSRFSSSTVKSADFSPSGLNSYISYFLSHLGRKAVVSPIKACEGGTMWGEEVYAWDFVYIGGIIAGINVYFPENTDQDSIVNNIEAVYGQPYKVETSDGRRSATWENESTGIDSSLIIDYNEGMNSSCRVSFRIDQNRKIVQIRDEWEYLNYDGIRAPVTKNILYGTFLNDKIDIANKRLKSLPWFFY